MKLLRRTHLWTITVLLAALLLSVSVFANESEQIESYTELEKTAPDEKSRTEAGTATDEEKKTELEEVPTSEVTPEVTKEKEEGKSEAVRSAGDANAVEEPSEGTTPALGTTEPGTTEEPDPEEPEAKIGWVTEGEDTYYYVETEGGSEPVKDQFYKIKEEETGSSYYYGFDEDGKLIRSNISAKALNGYYRGFDENGRMLKSSWLTVGEDRYYLDHNHRAVRDGIKKIDDVYYGFDENGKMQRNSWFTVGEDKYYLDDNGQAISDTFKKIDGTYYGFSESGKLIRGDVSKKKINDYYRGFNKNGEMLKSSWLKVGDVWYYFEGHYRGIVNAVNKPVGIGLFGQFLYLFRNLGKIVVIKVILPRILTL